MTLSDYFDKTPATQEELAAKIKRSQGFVSKMASGKKPVPAELVKDLVVATNNLCTPHDLRPDMFDRDGRLIS